MFTKITLVILLAAIGMTGFQIDSPVSAHHSEAHCQDQNPTGGVGLIECRLGISGNVSNPWCEITSGAGLGDQYKSNSISCPANSTVIPTPSIWCKFTATTGPASKEPPMKLEAVECPVGTVEVADPTVTTPPVVSKTLDCFILDILGTTSGQTVKVFDEAECTSLGGAIITGTDPGGGGTSTSSPGGSGSKPRPDTSRVEDPHEKPAEPFAPDPPNTLVTTNIDVKCADPENPTADDNTILCKFMQAVNFLSIGVAIVASITVATAGLQYTASRGSPEATAKAIGRLVQVGIAIVMYIFGWALLNWLIPGGVLN